MTTSKFVLIQEFFNEIRSNFSSYIINPEKNMIFTKDFTGDHKEGAFSKVYKGTLNGKPIAYKDLKLLGEVIMDFVKNEVELNAIIAELKILSKINHPNIPKLYGITLKETNNSLCLILEYVDGVTLKQLLSCKAQLNWSYSQKLWIIFKISQILNYIRHIGVVHRDIKPENILIENGSNLEPYIIDFGLSKLLPADSYWVQTYAKCTPNYSAPENILCPDEYASSIKSSEKSILANADDYTQLTFISYKVDVWSLGCVLYEIFLSRLPWEYLNKDRPIRPDQIMDLFEKQVPIYSPEDQNNYPEIIAIVKNCTKQDCKERWEIEKVCEELENLLISQRKKVEEKLNSIEYKGDAIVTVNTNGEKENIYDGLGQLSYKNFIGESCIYTGGFQSGNKYGYGVELWEDGKTFYYQGNWKNQQQDGLGYLRNLVYNTEEFYLGSFKKKNKHGYGKFVSADTVAIGEFFDDNLIEGYKYDKANEIIFKGIFNEDQLSFGEVIDLKTGEIYCGDFKDGERNGIGYVRNINNPNLIIECGQWKDNELIVKV